MSDDNEIQKITETLYQHNLELAVKNKTLLLLEKLYQTSILTLAPEVMAEDITNTIRDDLNLEFAGIFLFDKEADSLKVLSFSKTERLKAIVNKLGFLFKDIVITDVSKNAFFKQAVYDHVNNMTNSLEEVWGGFISKENLEKIRKDSHIKTMVLCSLMTGKEVLGVLLFALNRDYESLNTFEKESIKSFINVIALSLDKVLLYKDLQVANFNLQELLKQRESLVHLVTHKVKGSFTRSKYIFAGMLEGMFGEINEEVRKRAEQGLESDNMGIETVDLVLNAANLEKGTVKYEMKTVDFKELAEKTVSEKKISAEARGLKLESEMGEGTFNVSGDPLWLKEVINNLVENSIKYTKEGTVKVGITKKDNKVLFYVKDTGVGITPEDRANLFTEGGRGKDSVKINVDSTGYGLYSVKMILDAHKGKVWVDSEGPGKGSTFWVELDAI